MSNTTAFFAGLACAALTIIALQAIERRSATAVIAEASAAEPAKPAPRCLRERRMHIYGTYQAWGSSGSRDAPVDLQAVECLEWEVLK